MYMFLSGRIAAKETPNQFVHVIKNTVWDMGSLHGIKGNRR